MGNYLGLPSYDSSNQEIEELKQRLSTLETIDKNGDGKLSKDEMDAWITSQKKDLVAFEKSIDDKYQQVIQENQGYKGKITELECYIDTLKHTNEELKTNIQHMRKRELEGLSGTDSESKKLRLSEASKAKINEFVDELLNDKNVNIKYLPDFVEKQIYRNVFNILINLLDNVFETTSIEFMGHKLTFDINPDVNEMHELNED